MAILPQNGREDQFFDTLFQAVVFPSRTPSLGRRDSGDELQRAGMTEWAGLFCKNLTDTRRAKRLYMDAICGIIKPVSWETGFPRWAAWS